MQFPSQNYCCKNNYSGRLFCKVSLLEKATNPQQLVRRDQVIELFENFVDNLDPFFYKNLIPLKVEVMWLNNIDLSQTITTIDQYSLQNGDLVLLSGQTISSQNGIYIYDSNSQLLSRYLPNNEALQYYKGKHYFYSCTGKQNGGLIAVLKNEISNIDSQNIEFLFAFGNKITFVPVDYTGRNEIPPGFSWYTIQPTSNIILEVKQRIFWTPDNLKLFENDSNNNIDIDFTATNLNIQIEDSNNQIVNYSKVELQPNSRILLYLSSDSNNLKVLGRSYDVILKN